jgi:cytosine/adenosine deaminase-related metal-dependent hydrolase
MTILIKSTLLIATMDDEGKELHNCDLLIEGPRISAIGHDLEVPDKAQVIDARNKILLPGFVNTHHHMYQIYTRDLQQELQEPTIFGWLRQMYRLWSLIDAEMIYTAALVELGMLAKTGCTLVSDNHYLFPEMAGKALIDAQIQAAREVGIRFHPTRGSVSPDKSDTPIAPYNVTQPDEDILQDYERLVSTYHDPSDFSMLRIGLGPTNISTSSENLLRETIRFARRHGLHCHTHLAEAPEEDVWCMETHGMRPFDYLESIEWVGPDVWYAHCLRINDDEIRRMGAYRCGVATNPSSNTRFSGILAPIFKMIDAGVRVGLGVDGAAGFSDMLTEIQITALLHMYKEKAENDPRAFQHDMARDVLRVATRGGASVLGWDSLATIEVGKAADLTLYDTRRLNYAGSISDPLSMLVRAGASHYTDTTIVNGEIIVEDGKLVNIDEHATADRANQLAQDFLERADI